MGLVGVLITSFAAALVAGSFFEWALHRYLMHGVWFKTYPYRTHDQIHHVVFDGGPKYQLRHDEDRAVVTMAWWNAPLLFLVNAPIPALVAWAVGSWWVLPGAMAGYMAYYATYEYLHWCMHVPGPRWFQGTRVFKWINRHHRLHHLDPMTNLNVVLPIADFVLRTRRSSAPVLVGGGK